MPIGSSGDLEFSRTIGRELGLSSQAEFKLKYASTGGYGTINTNNDAANRPDGAAPHMASEFYSYDHNAVSALSGDYGNTATSTRIITSSSATLQTYIELVSGSDYAGSSVIGYTGHVYFRMESINNYRQDAQLYEVDFDGGGYHTVGNPLDPTYGYSQWKTTNQTTNASYSHGASWSTVTTGTSQGKWNHDVDNTPSGSTGVNVGSTGCIYYEGSGNPGALKDVYLRSKEITFTTNTIKSKWYHSGAGFANPARVWMGIYITG